MKKIIEELYFGSINMQETINSASIPEYKKKIQQISDQELSFFEITVFRGKRAVQKVGRHESRRNGYRLRQYLQRRVPAGSKTYAGDFGKLNRNKYSLPSASEMRLHF